MFIIEEEIEARKAQKLRALKLGNFYKDEGLYDEAIKNYELYIFLAQETEVNYITFKNLAICYSLNGLTAEAINNLKKAYKLDSEDESVVYLLAQMYAQAGIVDEAEYYYNELLEKNNGRSSVYYQLGEIYYKKGDFDKAIDCWEKVIEIEPTNSYTYYLLGSLFFYKKNYDLAVINFKLSYDNGSRNSNLYNYLGKTYSKLGEKEKARINFLIAIEKETSNVSIYKNYLKELNEEEIKREEEKLVDLSDYELNRFRLAILYEYIKDFQKAINVLEDLSKSDNIDFTLKTSVRDELNDLYSKD